MALQAPGATILYPEKGRTYKGVDFQLSKTASLRLLRPNNCMEEVMRIVVGEQRRSPVIYVLRG